MQPQVNGSYFKNVQSFYMENNNKKKMVKDSNDSECPLQPHFTEMDSRGRVFPEALHHAMKKSAQRFVVEL